MIGLRFLTNHFPSHARSSGVSHGVRGAYSPNLVINKLWAHLSAKLAIKDLGEARWTLQMSIQQDPVEGVLKISQENYMLQND